MYSLSCLPSSIFVGRQDEKNYRTIEFDVSEWVAKFPQANIYIAAYRPDGYIYLPEVELAGDKLIWHVSEADAAAPGNGEIELRVADNELLGKSQKVVTMVTTSISGNGGSVPVPPPDWTEEAAALDARVTYLEEHGSGGGGMDIHALQPEDNINDADETPFYDASADAQRKTTWANVKAKLKAYFDNIYLTEHQSLADYASKAWVEAKGYITSLAGYATEAWVTAKDYATKSFVNSSIGTNTAYYISNNGQPFQSLAQLQAYSGTVTNNDYAFVVGTDAAGNTTYTRYKYNSASAMWGVEYVLNNSSFTATQWAAIQSGITSGDVELIQTALQPSALNAYRTASAQNVIDSGKLSDAPIDGKQYARKNGAWAEVQSSGGGDNTLVVTVWLSDYGTPAIIGTPSTTHAEIIDAIENGKDITLAAQIDDSSSRYNFDIARSDGDYFPVVFCGLIPSNDEYWGEHTTVYISVSPSDVWSISYDDYALKSDLPENVSDLANDAGYLTLSTLPIYDGSVV